MAKKNFYSTLGVEPGADEATIKKAYRRKAEKAHPDKGGSDEEMAEVNNAYDCLKDPTRRLLYDATGEDSAQAIEQEVQNALMNEFAAAINADELDILDFVRKALDNRLVEIRGRRQQTLAAKAKFERKRERLKTKEGVTNLFHLVIDRQLLTIDAALGLCDRQESIVKAMQKCLDSYEQEEIPTHIIPRRAAPGLWVHTGITTFGE